MIKKKSPEIKTIIVECKMKDSFNTEEFEVDPEIFDDVYLEAATRFVERYITHHNTKIPPILSTYKKDDEKNFDKHYAYNSYYVIINAGFYRKAEIMRKNFITLSGIDLKTESLKSSNGRKNNI